MNDNHSEKTALLDDNPELQIPPQSTSIQKSTPPLYQSFSNDRADEHDIETHPSEVLIVSTRGGGLGTQSSLVTIFSMWNTMMGTSLLTMPWAISQAGFTCGIVLMIFIGGLSFYTTKQIVNFAANYSSKKRETLEFSDICRAYLGPWGDRAAFAFSLCAIFGALIVFYVLMSNFLYNTGRFVYEKTHVFNTTSFNGSGEVFCAADALSEATEPDSDFFQYWNKKKTIPFYLLIIIFPLMNIKSPTFFTKFNALGTISVIYVIVFTIYNSAKWGVNIDFSDSKSPHYVAQIEPSFPALSGTLTLAFFIHNCVLSITRYQKHPKNNSRDVLIAYILVGVTYSLIGFVFYLTYPMDKKSCIDEVLLENFAPSDGMAFGVRLVFLFQLITVLPLLVYIIRIQIMNFFFGKPYPSFLHIFLLNVFLVVMSVLFACFYPHVGGIIRFTGALCGLTYVYALPPIIYMKQRKKEGRMLTKTSMFLHCCIIGIGILNFIGQFIISA
ncbi:sodium-coupled neutral amino acid transporter 9 homolog isoform X2 [Dendronephthya gigantea]|uniref:sodium-coupled neutral amino acid transporter 9 homolog isoform X2 n=1 Tax=Dendronephthya gigantea TaxID=151771 RepID=UPI00106A3427|nr:sodium-coupled neutral amino acid transporter 9 homolog isoform X2 [Dendronephthya gigantea]XP_028404424.1 sodium-coupled neutral amino acid transporter 9 homolog isoform X2 [Dendronephthya gigantea]XP_028404425.1 sodium-coupled neutral amino acid transporter 9 homolog isoform X2 [Dendronephthya gigantea]